MFPVYGGHLRPVCARLDVVGVMVADVQPDEIDQACEVAGCVVRRHIA